MAKRVAVIILNWNGEKLLREFLPSVVKNTNTDLGRVVVVDNHSTDGSWICLDKSFRTWNGCCSRIISDSPGDITGQSR